MPGTDGTAETQLAGMRAEDVVVTETADPLEAQDERYATEVLLGRGGMGDVNLCHDRHIGRHVALKQIRLGVHHNAEARRRFLREAKVQAQLEHPVIVPVYDIGVDEHGKVYFTMKRVRGRSLRQAIDQLAEHVDAHGDENEAPEGMGRRRLWAAFDQICLAVSYAHERGVIHRDIKPDNIMLGDFGEVYLLDWGLAKVAGESEDEQTRTPAPAPASTAGHSLSGAGLVSFDTAAGSGLLGTPGYMSPEQIAGTASTQNDIYALGVVLYELLTLSRLHRGNTLHEILASTIDGNIEAPSQRAPLEVPPELERMCLRALAAPGSPPFEDAGALRSELVAFLAGDQDLELRREVAAAAAAAAQALAQQALENHDDAARAEAMGELGRALGVEPGNKVALRTLAQLLASPPKKIPESAARSLEEAEATQMRVGARSSAFGYLSWLVYVPLLWLMGIREATWLVTMSVMMIVAAGVHLLASRSAGKFGLWLEWGALSVGTLALATSFRMFGLFVLFPSVLLGQVVGASLSPRRGTRIFAVVLASAVLLAVALLEWTGVFAQQTMFDGQRMIVLPGMTDLPETLTPVVLIVSSIALFVTPVLIIGKMREELTQARRRIEIQAWHFRQLVSGRDLGPEDSATHDTGAPDTPTPNVPPPTSGGPASRETRGSRETLNDGGTG